MSQILTKKEQTTDIESGIACYKNDIPAGATYPLHWHNSFEFEIIISGRAKHIYNNQESIVSAGSAYMMCHYDFHEFTALTNVELYHMHFDKNVLDPQIAHLLNYNEFQCHFSEDEMKYVVQRINVLLQETNSQGIFRSIIIHSILNELVIIMLRKRALSEAQPTLLPIQHALVYLNEHFLENVSLEELAKKLSFSPNYLGKLFKQQLGCGFKEYLNTIRLEYACNLLRSSNMSVKEVSDASGYHSVEYFMYAFKKKMSMTPGQYRKSKQTTCHKNG